MPASLSDHPSVSIPTHLDAFQLHPDIRLYRTDLNDDDDDDVEAAGARLVASLRAELDDARAKLKRAEEDERYARDELEVARVALVEEARERVSATRELKATHDLQVWDLEDYIQVSR